ncbi:MAG: hypothetical protein WC503_06870 [Candidatus Shapirobacteria bacterium]
MNTLNLKEKLRPLTNVISQLFSPPVPRQVGTCITHSGSSNIQIHTPVEIIIDPNTGEKHCNCPSFRQCIQSARVIAGAKVPRY